MLFWRYGRYMDFPDLLNWSLICSLFTTPFGWASDQLVLIVPMLYIIARALSKPLLQRLLVFAAIGLIFAYSWWFWLVNYQELPNLAVPLAVAILYGYASRGVMNVREATEEGTLPI